MCWNSLAFGSRAAPCCPANYRTMAENDQLWVEVVRKKTKKQLALAKAKAVPKAQTQAAPKAQGKPAQTSGAEGSQPFATTLVDNSSQVAAATASTAALQWWASDSIPAQQQPHTNAAATGEDGGFCICPICQAILKGGAPALRMHQASSSKCWAAAAGYKGAGRSFCPHGCGKKIASDNDWALAQHEQFCVKLNQWPRQQSSSHDSQSSWPGHQNWSSSSHDKQWADDRWSSRRRQTNPSHWQHSQRWGYWAWVSVTPWRDDDDYDGRQPANQQNDAWWRS